MLQEGCNIVKNMNAKKKKMYTILTSTHFYCLHLKNQEKKNQSKKNPLKKKHARGN